MADFGVHAVVDLHGCKSSVLNSTKRIEEILMDLAKRLGVKVIHAYTHQFTPHGVSSMVMIAESHLSMHTWPEHGYVAMDFFTCRASGEFQKWFIAQMNGVVQELGATRWGFTILSRGDLSKHQSLETSRRERSNVERAPRKVAYAQT